MNAVCSGLFEFLSVFWCMDCVSCSDVSVWVIHRVISLCSPQASSVLIIVMQEKDKATRFAYIMPTIPSRRTTDMDEKENR